MVLGGAKGYRRVVGGDAAGVGGCGGIGIAVVNGLHILGSHGFGGSIGSFDPVSVGGLDDGPLENGAVFHNDFARPRGRDDQH